MITCCISSSSWLWSDRAINLSTPQSSQPKQCISQTIFQCIAMTIILKKWPHLTAKYSTFSICYTLQYLPASHPPPILSCPEVSKTRWRSTNPPTQCQGLVSEHNNSQKSDIFLKLKNPLWGLVLQWWTLPEQVSAGKVSTGPPPIPLPPTIRMPGTGSVRASCVLVVF